MNDLDQATTRSSDFTSDITQEPAVSPDSRSQAHQALDRVLLAGLERFCRALVGVYGLLILASILGWAFESLAVLLSTTLALAVVAVAYGALRQRRVSTDLANPLATVVAVAAFVHLLTIASVVQAPLLDYVFVLAVAGLGFAILSPRWLIVAITVNAGSWAAVAWTTATQGGQAAALMPIGIAVAGAAVSYWGRLTRTRPLREALASAESRFDDLRATEHALRIKHQQYRSIFDAMIDGLTIRSLDQGRLLAVNPAAADLLGYTREEFLELEPADYIHRDSLPDFAAMLETVGRNERFPYRAKAIHRDGSILDIEGCFVPFGFDTERMALGIVKDVTERNAALARLSASEERYRTLVEDQTEFVVRWTPDGNRTFVNQAYCSYLGEPKEALLGRTFFPEEDEAERLDILRQLEDWSPESPPITSLQLFRMTDGSRRWIEWSDRAVLDSNGELAEVQSIGRDVHERVLAQERQRASDDRFRQLFEHSPDAIFVESRSGRVLDVNPAACRLHGMARDELLGCDIEELVPDDLSETMRREFRELVAGSKARIDSFSRGADGSSIPVSLTAQRIDYDGQEALLVHARDISEQHAVSEALRQSEEKFRRLFEQTKDALVVTDANRAIEDANPAALELFGCKDLQELIETDPTELYEDLAERDDLIRCLDEEGQAENVELHMVSKQGKPFTVHTTVTTLRDGAGRVLGYRTMLRDVSDRQQLQRQLRQAQKMEAAGRLAGGLAHDFNNMLTVIGGYAYLGLQAEDAGPFTENFTQIQEATRRATDLTSQLLAFSRQQELRPQRVLLNDVITGFEALLRGSLTEDVLLELNLDPGLGTVEVDPGQIEQVLMNLAVNAGHAMPGGGRLTIETRNADFEQARRDSGGTLAEGDYVNLIVSDTGCGMDEATRSRVFEPFFTTRKEGLGTGLGLSTAYGIIQQSGGSIAVYSELDQGSVFKIYLPRVATGPRAVTDVQPVTTDPIDPRPSVLIADDDSGVRSLLANALARDGMVVHTAGSAEEAREALTTLDSPIDALLTDLILPGDSGIDLARSVRAEHPGLAVVVMSGYPEQTLHDEHDVPEGVEYLGKPFKIAQVSELIVRAIAESKERLGTARRLQA